MKVLAIDPSLNSTGVAYHDSAERDGIYVTTIPVKRLFGSPRLLYVRECIRAHIDIAMPDIVFYEDYAMGAKGRVFSIGELGGVLKTLCYENGIPVVLTPPSVLKLFTSGRGNADKEAMIAAVYERWGRQFSSDDEADAYALYKLGEVYTHPRRLRQYSAKVRDAIRALDKVTGKPELV